MHVRLTESTSVKARWSKQDGQKGRDDEESVRTPKEELRCVDGGNRGARDEGLEETEIATKTTLASSGRASERDAKKRKGCEEEQDGRGWEREE